MKQQEKEHNSQLLDTGAILRQLMAALSSSIMQFFSTFDIDGCGEIVDRIVNHRGHLVFTGVGKSGFVAQKIAATMNSSGTPSFFLSPQDALHGDLGLIQPGQIVFLLSKSGQTSELVELCPALRNKGAYLIAVVSSPLQSRLGKASDYIFTLPELQEICPFDLAPTTSTLSQLIFGDLLSMTIMRKKGTTRDDFILNHPAGRIGKRHLLRVSDLMLTGNFLPICHKESLLSDVLVELTNKKCGCICVVDSSGVLQGLFTDGDLRRVLQRFKEKAFNVSIGDVMTQAPKTITSDVLAYIAMQIMEDDPAKPVTVLPVINNSNVLVGLIRMHDILQSGL